MAIHGERPCVGPEQRGHRADERGLARTVGAEDGDDVSRREAQIQLGQSGDASETLGEAARLDKGSHEWFLSLGLLS